MGETKLVGLDTRIRLIHEPAVTAVSERSQLVCRQFGLPLRESPFPVVEDLTISLHAGSILLLAGPSGSGKSSILAAMKEQIANPCWVHGRRFAAGKAIVDQIAPRAGLGNAMEILAACGLGEPKLWLRPFRELSEGERFRAALSRAIGEALVVPTVRPILCDEFVTTLHRRAARGISFCLRKLVTRYGLILVAATSHDDMIDDLQPDQIIRLGSQLPRVCLHTPREQPLSLRHRAMIEPGTVADYQLFAPMHYRHRDNLGFVDKVFLLRAGRGEAPIGIVVYAHAPLELALRNDCTRRRFQRNPRRLNRELRILRRLVMHPDVRGCGLGHWLVRQTLPRVGVRFVECLASMGSVNPIFEKAGMTRIGRCPLPRGRLTLVERLRAWKLDPFSHDFELAIGRRPRVRALVQKTIEDWTNVAHGMNGFEVLGRQKQELAAAFRQIIGDPPVYYIWDRDGEFPHSAGHDCGLRTDPHARTEACHEVRDRHNPHRQSR